MKRLFFVLIAVGTIIFFSCQKQVAEGGGDGPIFETCDDGIKNQDETGVDCGGSCPVCIGKMTAIINGDSFTSYNGVLAYDTSQSLYISASDQQGRSISIFLQQGQYGQGIYPLQQFQYHDGTNMYSFLQSGSINFTEFNQTTQILNAEFFAVVSKFNPNDTVRITDGKIIDTSF